MAVMGRVPPDLEKVLGNRRAWYCCIYVSSNTPKLYRFLTQVHDTSVRTIHHNNRKLHDAELRTLYILLPTYKKRRENFGLKVGERRIFCRTV